MKENPVRLRKTNSSGYEGVSWHKGGGKWTARIRAGGSYRHLGLFETAEEAAAAYRRASGERENERAKDEERAQGDLLPSVKRLYETHGIKVLSTPFLEKARLYSRLIEAGFPQPKLLAALGLTEEYAAWRTAARTYRGVVKPKWSWRVAVAKAAELKEREGDLPTVEWCRRNGYSSLTNAVHASGRTWADLREAVGCSTTLMSAFPSSRRVNSWLSGKRLFWAVPGRAGGAAVKATVDHTLMRGFEPHDR